MKKHIALLLLAPWLLSVAPVSRYFPAISYETVEGRSFTNDNFKGNKSIVLLFHLGCPPAMWMLGDMAHAKLDMQDSIQIIGILENTSDQVRAFNDSLPNDWSSMRRFYRLDPIGIPLIAECEQEKIIRDESGNMVVQNQCRLLAKKIGTKSSPTLVYVDETGKITSIKEGYPGKQVPVDQRIAFLLKE